ncbi:sodium:alanine symporter family protein [Finegoldia magna]|uniref:Sodium/alanine symporter n=1 Tax=Finegoldia magna (strain ATCC 29328 / DSM 20472 / WAL 2508) TaxID=334413 RepID=B0S0V6_FINM2|nr:sodium:alanine symporter family protein [Finegoldia magna]MDU4731314.1 sodium:alanine symporter family protein [Finegoldia magna]MDU5442577.1 sodium:alanine symporter family protein [Finegoldia magna]UEA70783.1 sodium:alanine symporter family protein [Finegoldia magna]BAG07856.1 sodium/alanine symporter [Finegoldia magna ATCC 29328]
MDQKVLNDTIVAINSFLSNNILLIALLGCGIFYTIYSKGVQFRKLGAAFKQTFGGVFSKEKKSGDEGVSSFQALAVAIAAQVGTGNVAGVATAIMAGGPGAIFWMWLAAILGMATIYAEAVLAQKFREKDDEGNFVGGPAYYIKNGIGPKHPGLAKVMSTAFAILIVIALGFVGNIVQSNSIATSVVAATGGKLNPIIVGIVVAVLAGGVFIGGIKRIANFAQLVVPFMALVYIIAAIIMMVKFHAHIIPAFKLIFEAAFNPEAALGGALGITIKMAAAKGVGRGLFSNEAGMGSTPHAHATANVAHPVLQGYTAMVGVFIDTIVICTVTALMILVTEAWTDKSLNGALVTQEAFTRAFGPTGTILLAVALGFFAFTTIVGWYYFGETNIRFLFGHKGLWPYRILVLLCIIAGSLQEVDLVWNTADLTNSLMVIPNIIAIIMLHKHVKNMTLHYETNGKEGSL